VHIDAQPVAALKTSKQWFDLGMRRIAADPVDRARFADKAERAARDEVARAAAAAAILRADETQKSYRAPKAGEKVTIIRLE
jgi:hypothetical protein